MKIETDSKTFKYRIPEKRSGIEPFSAAVITSRDKRHTLYTIGKFFSIIENGRLLDKVETFFSSEYKAECDLVCCWLREALHHKAEILSIAKGTYTMKDSEGKLVETKLPNTIEESKFDKD